VPLLKWRHKLGSEGEALMATLTDEQRDGIYRDEPALWGYFVEGAPVLIPESVCATRKIVNGSPGLQDSCVWVDNIVPCEVAQAYARGGFCEVEVEPPMMVNIRMSGGLWHGVPLPDLRDLVGSVFDHEVVVPFGPRDKEEDIDLYTLRSAWAGLPAKLKSKGMLNFMLAFALSARSCAPPPPPPPTLPPRSPL
jgi:hypothetical protein